MSLYLGSQKISNLGETYTPLEIQSVNGKYSSGGNITVYGSDVQVSENDSRTVASALSSIGGYDEIIDGVLSAMLDKEYGNILNEEF